MSNKGNTKYIKREIYPEIKRWLFDREIIAIAGPRQPGKTTLLQKLKVELEGEKAVFVNFKDSEQLSSFQKSPKEFVDLHIP